MSRNPYDFAAMTPEERAELDAKIARADAIQLYRRSRAGSGIGLGGAGAAADSSGLARAGGVAQPVATQMARYRQWKNTTGGDPAFQGPLNMNSGEPEPVDTVEDKDKRNAAFFAGDADERSKILADSKLANERGQDHFFDEIVGPGKQPAKPAETAPSGEALTKAKAFVKGRKKTGPVSMVEEDDEDVKALRRAMGDRRG